MTSIQYAYSRFAKERFPLPDDAQVADLEQRIRIMLPEDYRRFILEFNGGFFKDAEITPVGEGCPRDELDALYGIGASHPTYELGRESSINLFDDNDPPIIVPIGSTPLGALILLDTGPGESYGAIYLKKAFGDSYYLAPGIEAFFSLLRGLQSAI